jgi:hypothetical protein
MKQSHEPLAADVKEDYGSVDNDLEANDVSSKPPTNLCSRVVLHPTVESEDLIPAECQADYRDAPEVGVAVKVISISALDMANNTFSADFNVNVAWRGAEDAGPDVQFYNVLEVIEQERSPEEGGKKGQDGWDFFYRVRCRATFRQMYDLQRFPYDFQDLRIDVRLKSACKLRPLSWGPNGEACSCDPRALMDEFILTDAKVDHCYMPSYKFGKLAGYDPEAGIILQVKRKPKFWVVNFGIVSSILCSLMACTYAIPVENIGERLGVAFTLVLTMTATKYLMMEKLPSVAYLTYLDWHILFCGMMLFLLTVQLGLTPLLGIALTVRMEHATLPIYAAVWVLYHCVIAWIVLRG